jgi:hypothetical protein
MKKIAVLYVSIAVLAVGVGQAIAQPSHARAATRVTVAMHDPGCHWFLAGGTYTRTLAVAGPARLLNVDEATLLVRGGGKVQRDPVGRTVLLAEGAYTITMVGQAPDDNHLKLVVG